MAARLSSSKFHRRFLAANPFNYYSCYNFVSSGKTGFKTSTRLQEESNAFGTEDDAVPTSGISKPLSVILKELNKKVPDSLLKIRTDQGFSSVKYIPWHIVNRIMNLHAPEWSGEVRDITYSVDGKSVSVVYHVTIYGTDAEIFRESTGTAQLVILWGLWGSSAEGRSNGISSGLCLIRDGSSFVS